MNETPTPQPRSARKRAWSVLAIVVALVIGVAGLVLFLFTEDSPPPTRNDLDPAIPATSVFEDPEAFVGDTVEVSGFVDDIIDLNVLQISSPDGSGDPLIVVYDLQPIPRPDQAVTVSGVIAPFTHADVTEVFEGPELPESIFTISEGNYALVATSIVVGPAE